MMNKRTFYLLVAMSMWVLNSKAQVIFETTIPNSASNIDAGYDIIEHSNGDFVATGSYNTGFSLLLFSTDSSGNLLWQIADGGPAREGYAIQNTDDGNFIIAGHGYNFVTGSHDMLLMKTEFDGTIIWTKHFGETDIDHAYSVYPTSDNGYIMVGSKDFFNVGSDSSDIFLVKTNDIGDSLWTKTYYGASPDYGYSVKETFDNGYIVAGYTESVGPALRNMYLLKVDQNGDTLWTKTFGNIGNSSTGYSVCQGSDSSIVITGGIVENSQQYTYTVKTGPGGNLIWESKVIGNEGQSVEQTSDNGFIIACGDSGLLKLDANGAKEWAQSFMDIQLFAVRETSDGQFIATGKKDLDPIIIKIGNPTVGIVEQEQTGKWIALYPNPFDASTVMKFSNPNNENYTLTICNLTGQTIRRHYSYSEQITIPRLRLASGAYIFRLENGIDLVGRGKLIVR